MVSYWVEEIAFCFAEIARVDLVLEWQITRDYYQPMHFLISLKSLTFAAAGCAVLLLAVSLGAAPGAIKVKISNCSCVAFRLDDIQDTS